MKPIPIPPKDGQESVWDYPRPPALQKTRHSLQIYFGNSKICESSDIWRVLETSHPPVYYINPNDFKKGVLIPTSGSSYCEWKGTARYYNIGFDHHLAKNAAWYYPDPNPNFLPIRHYVAVYAHKMERCVLDGEVVKPQPGNFYGGWITSKVLGPFKGEPGTMFW